MHKDRFDNFWYSSSDQGLYKYYPDKDSLVKILHAFRAEELGKSQRITGIDEDSNGDVWAIDTKGTLKKIENKSNKVVETFFIKKSFENNYELFIDRDDDIWILDHNHNLGAIYFNIKTKQVEYFTTNSNKCRLNNNKINGFQQDDEGKIWVGTDHGGLNIIDKTDFSVQVVKNNPLNGRSIAEDVISCIYKDYEGFFWIGTSKSGFSLYHESLFKFNHYKINLDNIYGKQINDIDNFTEDKQGNLWIGTNGGGLLNFNRSTGKVKHYLHNPKDPSSISSDIIIGLTTDLKGNIWIGTYFGGLNKFDGNGFKHYKADSSDPSSLTDDRIWDICEDDEGMLWIATLLGGVNVFDPESGKVIEVFLSLSDSTIRSQVVFSIIQDKKDKMWFATVDGIRSYDKETKKFQYFENDPDNPKSISDNHVLDVFEDSRGLIWAATTNGLNILDTPSGEFTRIYQKDGLPGNRVLKILEDDENNIWVSTTNGLSKIVVNPKGRNNEFSFTFQNFTKLDGLQDNEFNQVSAYKTSKGELLFGGGNGFNLFNPSEIIEKNVKPNIVFTELLIFNEPISTSTKIEGRKILEKSIGYTQNLNLKHTENVFTIEFANLNYFHPIRHNYQYKLEGFRDNWINATGLDRKITYTNLDPGIEYKFKVRVGSGKGSWSEEEALLNIYIKPPVYDTLWFKISVFLTFSILVALFIYLRIRNYNAQKLLLENTVFERTNELNELNTILEERQEEISLQNEELNYNRSELEKLIMTRTADLEAALKKAEDSDKLKSSFLANMSHEIRTPMNAIVGFSHLLKDEYLELDERNEYIDIIQKNCDSLLVLINDILDISKIEANQLLMNLQPFDIVKTFQELYNVYELREKEGVSIICSIPKDIELLVIYQDEIRLIQVIQNLMENALKFTEAGTIEFGFKLSSEQIVIFVKDTGIGISETDRLNVFKPFNKVETGESKLYNGAGLGLAICKRIVELMQGDINFTSEIGIGTTFSVRIPLTQIEKDDVIDNLIPKKEISKFENINILVAEDEFANYNLIVKSLRNTNITLTWAKNGKEAVHYIKAEPKKYHLILMDIKMPIMDGIKAFGIINEINPQLPVLAVTAYAYENEKVEILKNDFTGYITKPLKPETLKTEIEKTLNVDL